MTSALVTSVTGFLPSRGKATRWRPDIQALAYFSLRQPGLSWIHTRSAAAGERGQAPGASLLGQRIAAGAGQLTIGEGLGAGILERDHGVAAEAQLTPPASDGDSLDPAPTARRLHDQIQSVPIAVPAGFGDVAHQGGVEGVHPMSPTWFRPAFPVGVRQPVPSMSLTRVGSLAVLRHRRTGHVHRGDSVPRLGLAARRRPQSMFGSSAEKATTLAPTSRHSLNAAHV